MTGTFREVINNIKEGELWRSENCLITLSAQGQYEIIFANEFSDSNTTISIDEGTVFVLEPRVSFMDVVNSTSQCAVYHPLLQEYDCIHTYDSLDSVLMDLLYSFGEEDVKTIIKEGLWSLEPQEVV